jgi:hypothetical protein
MESARALCTKGLVRSWAARSGSSGEYGEEGLEALLDKRLVKACGECRSATEMAVLGVPHPIRGVDDQAFPRPFAEAE